MHDEESICWAKKSFSQTLTEQLQESQRVEHTNNVSVNVPCRRYILPPTPMTSLQDLQSCYPQIPKGKATVRSSSYVPEVRELDIGDSGSKKERKSCLRTYRSDVSGSSETRTEVDCKRSSKPIVFGHDGICLYNKGRSYFKNFVYKVSFRVQPKTTFP